MEISHSIKTPLVSVICNAYNQSGYIRKCLDSILMQETDFPVEILVHDDASSDGTAEIIREYEKKYPDKIFPIYQSENQYSKGIRISNTFQYPRIRGKYVAFCEGDDYWTDSRKLQLQVNCLSKYVTVDMCAHATKEVNESDTRTIAMTAPINRDGVLTVENVILGGGGYLGTNSLLVRREVLLNPLNFRKYLSFDYTLQISGAIRGGIYYINRIMSAHRSAAKNSWTVTMKADPEKRIKFNSKIRQMLIILDEETDGVYNNAIYERLRKIEIDDLWLSGKYWEIKHNHKAEYLLLSRKERILLNLHIYAPYVFRLRKQTTPRRK